MNTIITLVIVILIITILIQYITLAVGFFKDAIESKHELCQWLIPWPFHSITLVSILVTKIIEIYKELPDDHRKK